MREYRTDIDGLRAIAILSVAAFHADLGLPGGYVGVDVFFVLSGFLITGLIARDLQAGSFSLVAFWERRVRRILPAATLVVLTTLAVGVMILIPKAAEWLGRAALAHSLMLANFYYWWTASYFNEPSDFFPLLHTWSLAVEEQFYLLFPFVLALAWRRGPRVAFLLMCGLAIASFLVSSFWVRIAPDFTFYLLPSRAWELLLGGIVALLPKPERISSAARAGMTGTGLAAIAISCLAYSDSTPFPGVAAALPCVGTALSLWSEGAGLTWFGRALSTPPLRFIGLTSFSFYLWHWPILSLWRNVVGQELPPSVSTAALAIAFGLSVLTWRFVEMPFRRPARDLPSRTVVLRGILASALVMGASGTVWLFQGFPSRLDEEARRFVHNLRGPRQPRVPLDFDFRSPPPVIGACPAPASEPTLVLWGDSHADAVNGLFDEAAARAGMCGVTILRVGHVPVPGVWRRSETEDAIAFNHRALAWIERTPSIRHVVLVARWSVYLYRWPPDGQFVIDETSSEMTSDSAVAALRRRLAELVDRLARRGISVCIVKEVPGQDLSPQQIVIQRTIFGTWDYRGIGRDAHLVRDAVVDQAFAGLDPSRVRIIDPAIGLFDADGRSVLGDAEGAYYYDFNHLSPHGAMRAFGPLVDTIITPFDRSPATPANP